jgi:hypothetical protein
MPIEQTPKSSQRDRDMAHVPVVSVTPVLRCFHRGHTGDFLPCGKPAAWMRAGRDWFTDAYYCTDHRLATDVAAVPSLAVRRVRVRVEVYLSGVDGSAPSAQAEGAARVQQALEAIGALVDMQQVASSFVRYPALTPVPATNGLPNDPH